MVEPVAVTRKLQQAPVVAEREAGARESVEEIPGAGVVFGIAAFAVERRACGAQRSRKLRVERSVAAGTEEARDLIVGVRSVEIVGQRVRARQHVQVWCDVLRVLRVRRIAVADGAPGRIPKVAEHRIVRLRSHGDVDDVVDCGTALPDRSGGTTALNFATEAVRL